MANIYSVFPGMENMDFIKALGDKKTIEPIKKFNAEKKYCINDFLEYIIELSQEFEYIIIPNDRCLRQKLIDEDIEYHKLIPHPSIRKEYIKKLSDDIDITTNFDFLLNDMINDDNKKCSCVIDLENHKLKNK